jgi:hypothetical protein
MGWSLPAWAQAEPVNIKPVLIIELQTGSIQSARDKFVTIYNPNPQPIDVTGWQLQYRAANAADDAPWHTKARLSCELADDAANKTCRVQIQPLSKLWLASYDLGADKPSHDLKSSMASKGGQLRLLQPAYDDQPDVVQDLVSYGHGLDKSAPAPPKGQSLKRKTSADGQFINTNNNADDFFVEGEPEAMPSTPPANDTPPGESKPRVYPSIAITELLPISTNDTDSFIELYNPQDTPVSLEGYVLQTGLTWNHHSALPDTIMSGHSYLALFRSETHLQLIKKGSVARLLNPNGEVVSLTKPYAVAKPGLAWARTTDDDWQWTATPTPSAANILTPPPLVKPIKTTKAVADNSKPKREKADKKPKADKASTKKAKTAAKSKDATPIPPATQSASAATKPSANYWFIGAAIVLAVGYAVFEYRRDLVGWLRNMKAKLRSTP